MVTHCARCNKALAEGSVAFIQSDRQIDVRGGRVTFNNVDVVVCEACA